MIAIIVLLIAVNNSLVAGQYSDFCIDGPPKTCFTNWPTKATVCPNHQYYTYPYSFTDADILASSVADTQHPPSCHARAGFPGQESCLYILQAPDASQPRHPLIYHAQLEIYKSTNAQNLPSFDYGTMYWLEVRIRQYKQILRRY